MNNPRPWVTPEVGIVKKKKLDNWVVTSADARFWPWVATFYGSLREVAGYRGSVGLIDYGLDSAHLEVLASLGIERIPAKKQYLRVLDRYVSLAGRFDASSPSLVAHFDRDSFRMRNAASATLSLDFGITFTTIRAIVPRVGSSSSWCSRLEPRIGPLAGDLATP